MTELAQRKMDRGDYTVEKVYFESAPGFFVTGNLYRPKNATAKAPGVLFAHGHWADARLSEATDTELRRLASHGVIGVRLNLSTFGIRDPRVAADAAHALATRFVALGWHIQINTELPIIEGLAPLIADIKVPVVFDHVGNADAALGVNQKGFGALVALVKARNTYVKLSAPYNLSKRSDWADVVPLAKALIAAGPDRMLWGTNWPHPGRGRDDIRKITPYQVVDNPTLLTHFAQQCPDAALRKTILVDTPQRLYGFA